VLLFTKHGLVACRLSSYGIPRDWLEECLRRM